MGPMISKGVEADIIQKVKATLSNNQPDEAIKVAHRHISANPRDPYGYLALGYLFKKVRRYNDAKLVLDQVVQMNQGIVMAWSLRAICKALIGDWEGAIEDSKNALKLDPKDSTTLALKERLESRIRNVGPSKPQPPLRPMDLKPEMLPKPAGCIEPPTKPTPVPLVVPPKVGGPPKVPPGQVQTKFIAPRLSQAIVDALEQDRDSILVLVPKINAFMASIASMQALTEMYEMDGVVVCIDKPAKFLRKAFSKCSRRTDLVHYIELIAGDEPAGVPAGADASCPAFDLENLIKVIEEGIQFMANKHGGEDHFVMWDDASALSFFHEPKAMQRFFETLSDRLVEMGVVHFVVMSKEGSSIIQRWFSSAFKASINVKSDWMSRFN